MADVWTYDGVDAIGVTFTPESLTKQYVVLVDFGGTSGLQGPYPGGGPQNITATASAPPAGDFFSALRYDEDSVIRAVGLFLTGTSGPQTVSYSVLTYNGTATVTTNVSSSNVLYEYALASDDPASSITWVAGTGAAVAVSVADVGGISGGDPFTAHLLVRVAGAGGFGAFVAVPDAFTFGTPGVGAGSEGPTESSGAGGVRVSIAFDDLSLEPNPDWTDVTAISPSLVAAYEIDRGREDEFLSNDTGTARVEINDREGILDPTNAAGPYYTKLEPLRQILIELWNPVAEEWSDRFRGFIEDYDYVPATWTRENADGDHIGNTALEISCVDLRAIISAIEMQPDGSFGDAVPTQSAGNIFFEDNASGKARIEGVLDNAGIDTFWFAIFTLNIAVPETVYSPSQNVMEVIDDVAEADFPTLSVSYVDRHGVLAVHGRLAKFDPEGTAADAGPTVWDFHHWKAGDGTAVAASPSDTAHIRELAFNRGLGKIFNSAFCTPKDFDPDIDDPADQYFKDDPSIAIYGYRSWSSESLVIDSGTTTGNTANEECLLFATFIVTNYKAAKNRITRLVLKSMHKDDPRAAATWDLLANCDLADMVDVTLSDPGVDNTGGFNAEPFYIEGINERATPLNGEYAMVTTSLSVSPASYYADPVGLDGL